MPNASDPEAQCLETRRLQLTVPAQDSGGDHSMPDSAMLARLFAADTQVPLVDRADWLAAECLRIARRGWPMEARLQAVNALKTPYQTTLELMSERLSRPPTTLTTSSLNAQLHSLGRLAQAVAFASKRLLLDLEASGADPAALDGCWNWTLWALAQQQRIAAAAHCQPAHAVRLEFHQLIELRRDTDAGASAEGAVAGATMDPPGLSIQVALMETMDTYGLSAPDIWLAFDYLGQLVPPLLAANPEMAADRLDHGALVSQVRADRDRVQNAGSAAIGLGRASAQRAQALLAHIERNWSDQQRERGDRKPSRGRVQLVFGLEATTRCARQQLTEGQTSDEHLLWAQLLNVSSGGFALRFPNGLDSAPDIGELVYLPEALAGVSELGQLGMVRWCRRASGRLDIGVQSIPGRVEALDLLAIDRTSVSANEQSCLLVRQASHHGEYPAIVAPSGSVQCGQALHVRPVQKMNPVEVAASLTLMSGAYFDLIAIETEEDLSTFDPLQVEEIDFGLVGQQL